jgi:peptide/nickel transport system substrate-binding protein
MELSKKEILSRFSQLKSVYTTLAPEKVLIVWTALLITILFWCGALIVINSRFLIEVPALGGTISEGIVGTPRFINPVLATSPQDLDLTSLIYAGLTKRNQNGEYVPDMAESINVSEDGLEYNVTLKSKARFHDGSKVTADDVLYTINLVQNPRIKSPQFIKWEGVRVEKISDTEVRFSLKKAYPLFNEVLSLGILPKSLWKNLSDEQFSLSDYNIHPIGSGPFAIDSIDSVSGIPETYTLTSHKYYTLGRPYLESITIHTYQNEKQLITALNSGDIDRVDSISPNSLNTVKNLSKAHIVSAKLPRAFTIFVNPNKAEFLSDKNIRQALSLALDRGAIIDTVYKGYAVSLVTPYPFDTDAGTTTANIELAKTYLAKSKYTKANASTTFELNLVTTNSDEIRAVADLVKSQWEKIGVKVNVLVYEPSDINQSVIKDRDFQSLLFGSFIGHPSDLYAFWHSSQRTYPGVNISGYVSQRLDKSLEVLRESSDPIALQNAYDLVKKEFEEENPGIFLYSPTLIYINNDSIVSPLPNSLLNASDRFALVNTWYKNTERVWKKTYYSNFINFMQNIIH